MALSSVMRAKLTNYFYMLDLNRDGVLSRADYVQAADRVAGYMGEEVDSPTGTQLRAAWGTYWDGLLPADVDKDGNISLTEWLNFWESLVQNPEMVRKVVMTRGTQLLDMLDPQQTGRITAAQWQGFWQAYGYPESAYKLSFQKLDTNADGYISLEELKQAGWDFFTSHNPESVGNWFHGDYTRYLDA